MLAMLVLTAFIGTLILMDRLENPASYTKQTFKACFYPGGYCPYRKLPEGMY